MPKTREEDSLSRRATLALALWAGFYLLALGIAAGLGFFAWATLNWGHQLPPITIVALLFVCAVGLWAIVASIVPRWERFHPPGPLLTQARHPLLFEEIRSIADATGQKPPAEVYLELDANASVGRRGGFLGLFPRRILTLGLPLLRVLTRSQFRGVLAHEFGHFVAGDTRLGPWVYRTHAAIQRTVDALEGNDSIWRFPFLAYAGLFRRVSLEISQRQELAADALAARVTGSASYARALRRVHESGAAFPAFVNDELLPLVNAGRRPPLCEGFARFLGAQDISRAVQRHLGRQLAERKHDPYRTHPPLHERLAAIAGLPPGTEPSPDPPAVELLDDLPGAERELLTIALHGAAAEVGGLSFVSWEEAGEKAFLPQWRERAQRLKPHLAGIMPAAFPTLELAEVGHRIDAQLKDDEARAAAMDAIGCALLVALRDRGWTLKVDPGEVPALVKDEERVRPFHVFYDFAEGSLRRDAWSALCERGGFAGINLGA